MSTPPPDDDDFGFDLAIVGRRAADLLCAGPAWIDRRKHRVDFIDKDVIRNRHSVDFRVPKHLRGEHQVHLPLFVLRKAPQQLLDFDFRDEQNRALSLPTRHQNAAVSCHALLAAAQAIMERAFGAAAQLERPIAAALRDIAYESPATAARIATPLLRRDVDAPRRPPASQREALAADDDFRFLARLFSWTSVVAVPVDASVERHILKLAYSDPINEVQRAALSSQAGGHRRRSRLWPRVRFGLDPLPVEVDVPFVGARNFHVEVHPPDGMLVMRGLLAASTRGPLKRQVERPSGRAVHLYLSGATTARTGFVRAELQFQPQGFVLGGAVTAGIVSAVLAACVAAAAGLAANNTSAPALLLLLPGLIATFVLRPGEHALTSRLLRNARIVLMVSAATAYAAAGWLVAAPGDAAKPATVTGAVAAKAVDVTSTVPVTVRPARRGVRHVTVPVHTRADVTVRPSVAVSAFPPSHPRAATLRRVWIPLFALSLVATAILGVAARRAYRV